MKKLFTILLFVCFLLDLGAQRPTDISYAISSNSKDATPVGYGDGHYIEAGTEIIYTIYFQNNGTDTAFNVRILDTLSAFLDLSTIREEASSHTSVFSLLDNNVVKVSFANIRLPNFAVNENTSRGFVSFTISAKNDLPIGTVILNDATITFDFSPPILTNQVYHTIAEGLTQTRYAFLPDLAIMVYPNPIVDKAVFDLDRASFTKGNLQVFSTSGQLVQQQTFRQPLFEFEPNQLFSGEYFYKITLDGLPAGAGKLMVR